MIQLYPSCFRIGPVQAIDDSMCSGKNDVDMMSSSFMSLDTVCTVARNVLLGLGRDLRVP